MEHLGPHCGLPAVAARVEGAQAGSFLLLLRATGLPLSAPPGVGRSLFSFLLSASACQIPALSPFPQPPINSQPHLALPF